MKTMRIMAVAAAAFCAAGAVQAQEPLKIGMITTLSGPGGYLGQDIRDAFQLAIDMQGGKLGGVPVQVLSAAFGGARPQDGKSLRSVIALDEGGIALLAVSASRVPGLVAKAGGKLKAA